MIKFFRKIRQNLLSEGKTGKYLKYAIGEIILVVVGILIALQINLKSQEKTNRDNIESILKSVFTNLENDISHPINTYIYGFNIKDSIGNLILNKTITPTDYKKTNPQFGGSIANHLIYEFEPFQFQRQAYDRLMANIENIPEDYVPIVNLLQDVYSKEVPVVNEVALELKNFIDEIEDKYQNKYEWYSNADSTHLPQKVAYMISDPLYLNDVKRHQKIADHLKRHLIALKMQISIAYSRMYNQFNYNHPFPDSMEQFYFPTQEELGEYTGIYSNNGGSDITLKANDYYLFDGGNFKLVKANNKFVPITNPSDAYMEFVRNEDGIVNALTINRIRDNDTLTTVHNKIK
jgi:hypothetical protein